MKIAVCGAGYTGLAAGMRLAQAGHEVTILERSGDIGGLAGDFTIHGCPVEKAYHFLYPTDEHIKTFLAELGMADRLVWCESSQCCYYQGRIYPFNNELDLLKLGIMPFLDRIRMGATVFLLQHTKRGWKKLSRITAYDWLKRWAGPTVLDRFWAPLLRGKFNRHYQDISMQWLWGRLKQRMDAKRPGEKREKLGQIKGGFRELTTAMARAVERAGGVIRTNAGVTAIRGDGGRAVLDVNGKTERYDGALFTGPSPVFADVVAGHPGIDAAYLAGLRSIDYLGAIVHLFTSDQEITPYYWHNICETEWPFLVLINLTAMRDRADFAGKYVYYLAAYVPHEHEYFTIERAALFESWYGALAKMWPKFDRSQVREEHLFKMKYAQHVVGCGYDRKIPPFKSPIPGVYLANFSQIYPIDRGTNLAIRDGERVARQMMRELVPASR